MEIILILTCANLGKYNVKVRGKACTDRQEESKKRKGQQESRSNPSYRKHKSYQPLKMNNLLMIMDLYLARFAQVHSILI